MPRAGARVGREEAPSPASLGVFRPRHPTTPFSLLASCGTSPPGQNDGWLLEAVESTLAALRDRRQALLQQDGGSDSGGDGGGGGDDGGGGTALGAATFTPGPSFSRSNSRMMLFKDGRLSCLFMDAMARVTPRMASAIACVDLSVCIRSDTPWSWDFRP